MLLAYRGCLLVFVDSHLSRLHSGTLQMSSGQFLQDSNIQRCSKTSTRSSWHASLRYPSDQTSDTETIGQGSLFNPFPYPKQAKRHESNFGPQMVESFKRGRKVSRSLIYAFQFGLVTANSSGFVIVSAIFNTEHLLLVWWHYLLAFVASPRQQRNPLSGWYLYHPDIFIIQRE